MPRFEIEQNGKRYEIEAPSMDAAAQALGSFAPSAKPATSTAPGKPEIPAWKDFLKSIGTGIVGGIGRTLANAGQSEAELQGMKGVPGPQESSQIIQKEVIGRPLHQPAGTAGKFGEAIGGALGDPTTFVGPGGLARKVVSGIGGAVGSELGGQMSGDSFAGRLAGGIAGAMAPAGAAGAARRIAAPITAKSPERAVSVALLRREGIEPSAGDVSGRTGVRAAEELGNRTLGGQSYTEVKDRPLRQLGTAVTARMGENAERATPEVLDRARTRIGNVMERVATRLPLTHDQRLTHDLTAINTEITNNPWLDDAVRTAVARQINAILNGFTTRTVRGRVVATMDGRTYQGLTRKDTPLGRAIDSADTNVSHYAQRIRSALDDALERSATGRGTRPGTGRQQALAQLREARRQWYNMLVISKAVAGPGEAAAEGTIMPERLRAALTNSADNKMAYAAGRSDLHRLARAANEILTPARNLAWEARAATHGIPGAVGGTVGMLAGGPGGAAVGALGSAASPGLVGRAVNSRLGQAYLKRQRGPATPAHQWASALRGANIGAKQPPQYGGTE
jgi:hypothetical protein